MREETRRAIAYTAAVRINGAAPPGLYSRERRWHTTMSPGYDVDAQSHINASGPSLYHHGTANHINLQVNGSCFSGFAYGEGHHFFGSILGNSIEVFDYGEGQYFHYSI
ncbi:MAG: hypothetical protein GEU91_20455 [Rhizobiales bacterium]|nr:hypothetical protein [Hyphomicrobiales bacterium]